MYFSIIVHAAVCSPLWSTLRDKLHHCLSSFSCNIADWAIARQAAWNIAQCCLPLKSMECTLLYCLLDGLHCSNSACLFICSNLYTKGDFYNSIATVGTLLRCYGNSWISIVIVESEKQTYEDSFDGFARHVISLREFMLYDIKIATQKRKRRRLERKWRSTGLEIDRVNYMEQCNVVNDMLYKAKEQHYSAVIQENAHDSKLLFRTVDK